MRSTLFIFLLLLSACDAGPQPSAAFQVAPATFSDADFSTTGTLAISLREQVAIYSISGDMLQLIEVGEADASWQLSWVAEHLLAIADNQQILLWDTQQEQFTGSWNFSGAPLRALNGAGGRLLAGDAEGVVHTLEFTPAGELRQHHQLHGHDDRISALAIDQSGNYAVSASRNGMVRAWSLASQQPVWQWSAPAGRYATELTMSAAGDSLYIATNPRGELLGSPDEQTIVHMDAKSGTILDAHSFAADSHISSLLASDAGLVIGGSANQWWLMQSGVLRATRQYPRSGAFGGESGTLIALYSSQDSLHAATTSGYLQIWLKQDIVN